MLEKLGTTQQGYQYLTKIVLFLRNKITCKTKRLIYFNNNDYCYYLMFYDVRDTAKL